MGGRDASLTCTAPQAVLCGACVAQHDIVEMSFSELRYEESSERNVEEKHEKDHE
jgi:hypothetical protein